MRRFYIKISVILTIFLLSNYLYSSAQERMEARDEARQHYQQGKEFYSQGRYQEATSEFEKAIELIGPPELEFKEKIEKEQQRVLAPTLTHPVESLPNQKPKEEVKEEKEQKEKETEVTKPAVTQEPELETEAEERQYYIDISDVLEISVWQIPDLSKSEVIVRPDGKLSFPLIGDIKAEGLTLTQLDNVITDKLKPYVKTPEVSIMIRSFGAQANKVVVLGEVLGPGIYKFSDPPTITEVIAAAGGYTKYAVLNSIMVIRGVSSRPEAIRVNVAQVLKSARLSENIFLKPNDIIYVPRSFIGKINTFLEIIQPAINEYMQTLNARHLHNVVHAKAGI